MKKLVFRLLSLAVIASPTFAGTEIYSGKEMKQVVPPPCPQWYADNEFNVGLWGTYVFTGNEWQDDRYLEADHAWGGGVDLKYFFHRYFGVGIEGWVVDARHAFEDVLIDFNSEILPSIPGTRAARWVPCWARSRCVIQSLARVLHRTSSLAVAGSLAVAKGRTLW